MDAKSSSPTLEAQGLISAPPEEELHESMRADPEVSPEDATSSDQSLLDPITPAPSFLRSLGRPYAPTLQHFIVSDPARYFWQIAHTDYDTSDKMRTAIQSAIKDMNMTTGDPITRRDALCELASIPMIAMGGNATLKASRYEEMLRYGEPLAVEAALYRREHGHYRRLERIYALKRHINQQVLKYSKTELALSEALEGKNEYT